MRRLEPGEWAWAGLIAGVATYDYLCPDGQTMSEMVDKALAGRSKLLAVGAVAVTAAHLLNILPEPIDPLHKLANQAHVIKEIRHGKTNQQHNA